jgi:hypothetical protein
VKHASMPTRWLLGALTLWACCAAIARAQPLPGTPAEALPSAAPEAPAAPSQVAPAPGTASGTPPATVPAPKLEPTPDPFPASSLAPVLFVSEGVDGLLSVAELRKRLGEALGREVVSLTDPKARRAQASIWAAMGEDKLAVRVASPPRPEVWRQLSRSELSSDPVGVVVKAVLEMLWADAFARLDAGEIQDPFCPPGVICVDARRTPAWPPTPDVEVLDPWDTSYRRFYGWEPQWYGGYNPGPWGAPYGEHDAPRATRYVPVPVRAAPHVQRYALGMLAGGGVHKGGAFLRYEVNALRRFRRFDFGLTYVADRGQPEPFQKARRSISALLQRRFVAEDFELDLGTNFGIFFANFADQPMEVRPYLRGLVTVALPLGRSFDLLVQSDLATTFVSVADTGLVEYALSMGLRHRM